MILSRQFEVSQLHVNEKHQIKETRLYGLGSNELQHRERERERERERDCCAEQQVSGSTGRSASRERAAFTAQPKARLYRWTDITMELPQLIT